MTATTMEFRLNATNELGVVEGWATSYGNYISKYNMVHKKGMFAESLATRLPKGQIKFCWNHDDDVLLGAVEVLEERDAGLFVRARLSIGGKVPIADEKWELVKAGAINTFSVVYTPVEKRKLQHSEHGLVDEIVKADLKEVSLVSFEGDENATVTNILDGAESVDFEKNKAFQDTQDKVWDLESTLRDTVDALWEKWGEDNVFDLIGGMDTALAQYHAQYIKLVTEVISGVRVAPSQGDMEADPSELRHLKASEVAATTSLTLTQAQTLIQGKWPSGVTKASVLTALPQNRAAVVKIRQGTFTALCEAVKDTLEPAELTRLNALIIVRKTDGTKSILNAVQALNSKLTS